MKEFFSGVNDTALKDINFLDNFLALFTYVDPTTVFKNRAKLQREVNSSLPLITIVTNLMLKSKDVTWRYYMQDVDGWFQRLNMTKSFNYLLKSLWFSRLPCYDVPYITGEPAVPFAARRVFLGLRYPRTYLRSYFFFIVNLIFDCADTKKFPNRIQLIY